MLVDLGRRTATGARRRVRNLTEAAEFLGLDVHVLEVLPRFRSGKVEAATRLLPTVRSAGVVPETLAWSPSAVRRELERLRPTTVVCITDRCFHPELLGSWRTYVDFVDRLSVSYSDRARIASNPLRRLEYRVLSQPHRRFEGALPAGVHGAFAAGRADAAALGVDWVLIHAEPDPRSLDELRAPDRIDTDLAFVGTLDYPPNVGAVVALDTMWPELVAVRPGVSALIAGARPTRAVRDTVERNGWELLADFDSASEVFGRCRVAVAPLAHASGLQIKVLDAAAHAVPQVVSRVVASGLDPGFPLVPCDGADTWVPSILQLLDDPAGARELGERSRRHLSQNYGVAAAADQLRVALDLPGDPW